ncbi:MAG: hypothetical protein ACLTDF_10955 [Coprococcus sp.]
MHSCDSHHSGYTYNDDEGLMLDEISGIAYVADMKTHEMYFLNKAAKRSPGMRRTTILTRVKSALR